MEFGDAVILELVARLKAGQAPEEQLYCTAGDEFMVVFPHPLPLETLKTRVLDLQRLWKHPFKVKGYSIDVTASIVVTVLNTSNPEEFRKKIRELMVQAKQQGRNQVLFV